MGDLWNIISKLNDKGIEFKVLDQKGIDTTDATGKLLFNILGSIPEFERDLINSRTAEGRKVAQAKGVKFGRPSKITNEMIESIKQDVKIGAITKSAIAEKYEISRKRFIEYSVRILT